MAKKTSTGKTIETIKHDADKRKNIPTAEFQSVMKKEELNPVRVAYERRNRDLDPQLVWRGKDEQDWSDLVVQAPPLYIQEKVHPKALIDDLERTSKERDHKAGRLTPDLFADFNGIPKGADKTEFYQHDQNWSNRMILGDSLQVMASLAEREGLRGKVQCIYLDPPYGIKFNSNFQWSTTSRDVKDGKADHITREPEQVKAFRDTWRDGIHSYLTYLRDRLTVARDLLTESGSIFVQIGDENVHRVRAVMDEVFGENNLISTIAFKKTSGTGSNYLENIYDHVIWFAKNLSLLKYRQPLTEKSDTLLDTQYTNRDNLREHIALSDPRFMAGDMSSQGASESGTYSINYEGQEYKLPINTHWKASRIGMPRLSKSCRLIGIGQRLRYRRYADDFPVVTFSNSWEDTIVSGFSDPKVYVVQTSTKVIQRCLLMSTDPGDLVLDPTCGSGTTAYVAEQWGRRWITIDTSRVALALARARIMGARYPYFLLADSKEGQFKEAEVTRTIPSSKPTHGDIRHGFVYERVPHITLKSIANNAEIDVIWEKWQKVLDPLRESLNKALKKTWQEWEIPRELDDKITKTVTPQPSSGPSGHLPPRGEGNSSFPSPLGRGQGEGSKPLPEAVKKLHSDWWQARIARQKDMDASISAKAEFEYLYDKPYEDKKKVRVAGPFTVDSLSPHRVLAVDENDELIPGVKDPALEKQSFPQMILETLKMAGVQQAHKEDKITFTALTGWPGYYICAEGRYREGDKEKRAGIFIGPEFGTVQKPDLVAAARETAEAGFDVLIACAFSYDAQCTGVNNIGRINILRARMNADLHMAEDLKNTGKGNLFVIFGEPDISLLPEPEDHFRVKVNGVDVFHPNTGEVRSDGPDGIACWFLDTDYNEESFFVRQAYFLGANDPYSSLKTTLKAEIDAEAWATLHSNTSRPFPRPSKGRIAVKVINHLGDEVMKVFKLP